MTKTLPILKDDPFQRIYLFSKVALSGEGYQDLFPHQSEKEDSVFPCA